MRIHILGICGTFMSGVAILAKQSGHEVTGSDTHVYPPMSIQLKEQGIQLSEGYHAYDIDPKVDYVIVGNVIKRGNPAMEYVMSNRIPYISGPQWLAENVLKHRWVLAVAGTHGKTTTTSILSWILESAGLNPGFLVGGVPENFGVSARLGKQSFFVIEADEYDSAFFDKRSKFIHYHPKTLVLNNLEYDHADIFPNLAAIKQQFHYLLKTIPENGYIIRREEDANLTDVLNMGCFTPCDTFGLSNADWSAQLIEKDGSVFTLHHAGKLIGEVRWQLLGQHNVENALAAVAAAHQANVPTEMAILALSTFKNVKRRLEVKGNVNNIVIYDDFAHHPTAIATTLAGLRARIGNAARMIAVVEFGSYTMRMGVHKDRIVEALNIADMILCKNTEIDWGLKQIISQFKQPAAIYDDVEHIIKKLVSELRAGDHVVIMSNSGFEGIHKRLIDSLENG